MIDDDVREKRNKLFKETVMAFEEKFSWLGHQAARELLLSAASWNIEEYSNPPFRYRTHVMLAWEKGWFKSTILRKMASIIGDSMTSKVGKVTNAAMRGSTSGGQFTPPKVLSAPVLVSTEFGQTSFDDELLNIFLALLEEGETNISLNKIGSVTETQRKSIQEEYGNRVDFTSENEFDLKSNFVFWGGTYDPVKLEDDALRSRFNIVTPTKPLDYQVTQCADKNKFYLDSDVVKEVRNELRREEESRTDFSPEDWMYEEYNLEPRESAPLQSYMASRWWWGLPVNEDIMEAFIEELQQSRKVAKMAPEDRVFDLIFENPMTYEELTEETGYDKQRLYKLLNNIEGSERLPSGVGGRDELEWVVYSGDGTNDSKSTSLFGD